MATALRGVWEVDSEVTSGGFIARLQSFERRLQANMSSIFCPVHLCLGQEEVPAALHEMLAQQDWLFSTHRAHGHYLAKGGSEQNLWDEIMGLDSGINGGFSGSQEFSDTSINFHCSAIVGGLVGVATGAALALKLNGSDAIVVCCIGDAGVEQGVFWESANFAALHKLPIAFICENNGFSVDSPIAERQCMPMSRKAAAFGLYTTGDLRKCIAFAKSGLASFCEVKVTRRCDHLNMATMLPTSEFA